MVFFLFSFFFDNLNSVGHKPKFCFFPTTATFNTALSVSLINTLMTLRAKPIAFWSVLDNFFKSSPI